MIMAKDSHGNYVKIEDIKQQDSFNGISPIDFKSNGDNLKNYRIYGNTINGESVGDKTNNLFDNGITIENGALNTETGAESSYQASKRLRTSFIGYFPAGNYAISVNGVDRVNCILLYSSQNTNDFIETISSAALLPKSFTLNEGGYIRIAFSRTDNSDISPNDISNVMLNSGSTAPPYEPYGYRVPVKAEGKNLFNNIWEQGNIRADNGQKEASNIMICSDYFPVEYDKTYSISRTISEGYNNIRGYDASKNYIGGGTTVCSVDNPFVNANTKKGIFKITNSLVAFVRFNHYSNNLNMKYMIVEGDYTNTPMPPYEPYREPVITNLYLPEQIKKVGDEAEYIDFGEQKQHRVRKNLLQNTAASQTINDITFTVNDDGSVTCNGTATKITSIILSNNLNIDESTILSGCPINGGVDSYLLRFISLSPIIINEDVGSGTIINNFRIGNIEIRIASGYACDNLTFYPMIRKADILDDIYEPYITDTDIDVTLPAIPTLSGTNTLSVNTNIKPSKVWGGLNDPRDILYVKDKLGNILFSKYYEIEDEPPLTYKAKKAGALKNYRIYGNTVDGESVGDRTGNLFDGSWENKFIDTYGNIGYSTDRVLSSYVTVIPNQTYSVKSNMRIRAVHSYNDTTHTQALIDNVAGLDGATFTIPADSNSIRISLKKANDGTITPDDVEWCMLNTGSEVLPYEPYGYKVPMIIKGINLFDESVVVDKEVNTEYSNYQVYHQGGILYLNGTTTSTQADIEIAKMSSINSEMLEYINQNYGKYVFTSISPGTIQIRFLNSDSENYAYASNSYTSTSSRSANRFVFRMQKDYQYDHEPIGILIKKEQIQSVYEPYHAPTTTTLYLPEQIKKVGDEAEYIDFMEQGQHFADGTAADVTLPALPTFSGTNMLSVETGVQPSDIYLKGKIEKKPKIYYYSQDGQTLLYTESVLKGSNGIYSGTPTKMADPQYTYTFAGWSSSTGQTTATPEVRNNIQNDKNVYAAFSQTLNTYTVYFYNESNTLIETIQNVPYGGTATYTGATPTSSQAGYIFSGWSPSNTNITADTSCYAQFVDEDMYESISDTWSEIIANVSNGTYSTKYHIGNTKKIDLGTEGEVIMTIVGIDTDDLADNSGKAPITWISKQLLKTDHRMNPPRQDGISGTGSLGGWEETEMRSYLKETVKPLIPEAVRNAIKPVKKYTRIYNVSGSAVNNVLTTEDVWIPSYKEVFGLDLETLGPTYSTTFPDNASRIKSKAGSSAARWWLRSAGTNRYFYYVNADGSSNITNAKVTGGVALGFCT